MTSHSTLKKEFVKIINQLRPHHHPWDTFRQWLEIAAITMHQVPYNSSELEKDEVYAQYETKYLEAIKGFSREELNGMAALLGITIKAFQVGCCDFLGEIAGEQEWLNQNNSQFFTPYALCRMIAKMTLGDIKAALKEKGTPLTIAEPAVGAGALVIACAEEALNQGVDPRAHLHFDCVDVSRNAFNMAYVQLSAMGLQAIVRHGNTLSMEMYEHRPTMQLRLYNQWLQERQQLKRLELMRDLITHPSTVLDKAEDTRAQPAPSVPPPQQSIAEEEEQMSLFEADTLATDPLTKSPSKKRKSAIELPPPEQRQLGIFDWQKQAEK